MGTVPISRSRRNFCEERAKKKGDCPLSGREPSQFQRLPTVRDSGTLRGNIMSAHTNAPQTVDVHGQPLRCVVCQHDTFVSRRAQLHGGVATFFNMEWAARTCTCVICSRCGYVHWFYPVT
jgi:predicted nucleic-acid-binding Zn-ribbon protein